ncbi:hypothetical protein DelCs14_1777 [Delftia sp. Cs1-4]|uniref:hypothetical protein n=1 Tax=Delftia sp. (strain Cs1-4) TaxID=742013 RepID=UPI00020E7BD4|nr:hypothetical protein [Delftia sp. Cs1-4]AEF88803.1 hypothetical protein DelCs14_1777 [Delftia sp. Cs1-4]
MHVTLNNEQQLYVIPGAGGCSCLGFDNARDHANQIAERLRRKDLAFVDGDHGSLAGYGKYCAATAAWGRSPLTQQTYFDPGTDPKAARVLEACRRDGRTVRLMPGDTGTGQCWLEEYDVVGRIGRSTGSLKVPLLIAPGADGGVAILTSCLLRIVEWSTGRDLYRHPAFRCPDLAIRRGPERDERPWKVLHDGRIAASFPELGQAGAYLAFMCGETVEPRIFQ